MQLDQQLKRCSVNFTFSQHVQKRILEAKSKVLICQFLIICSKQLDSSHKKLIVLVNTSITGNNLKHIIFLLPISNILASIQKQGIIKSFVVFPNLLLLFQKIPEQIISHYFTSIKFCSLFLLTLIYHFLQLNNYN